ncbi:DUF4175 family protein [Pedobacter sp. JY14-1]|uniref:DUF4175 family protein n=1 Tax=Pedobacter sp. JY14-1 TaxID=3034151 RepID=UPI0023E2C23D|nr:DUF4175 family protein [Pedobacter sp. JY14-1]
MNSNYDLLIAKINEFTRKFYLNKLLRGMIYTAALLLVVYLVLFVLVFYLAPGTGLKTVMFFAFVLLALGSAWYWIGRPALSFFRLGKRLELEEAAELIGEHFFTVKDKLLNTLQLKALAERQPENQALILAGIDQKISELRPVPFSSAIRLDDNRKYLKYILAPLSVILLILIIAPAILKDGTSSLIQYDRYIAPKAPFRFELMNTRLMVSQGDDVTLKLRMQGNNIPQDVYLTDGRNSYKLEKENNTHFSYTFRNLQKDKRFYFTGGGFSSGGYVIVVRPRPVLTGLEAKLQFPSYLGRGIERVANAGDLVVPEGTLVTWTIHTENSDRMVFLMDGKGNILTPEDNVFRFSAKPDKSITYQVVPGNAYVKSGRDSIAHQISVVKDEFPTVSMTEQPDSLRNKIRYFSGNITDDYGFTGLVFKYEIRSAGKVLRSVTKQLPVKRNERENAVFFLWDANEAGLKPGEQVTYFFEVADNDGVNGPKRSRSEIKTMEAPTEQQVAKSLDQSSSALKQQMEKAIRLAGAVEKESKKLGETLLDKRQLNFDDKKQVEQLLEKQKQLEEAVREVKKLNEKQTIDKEENAALREEMQEKQKQIDHLFNNVLDEKTRVLLEKLQQLMDENNKEQTQQELSRMQMDNKSLKNELDRILELYKQLEFEQNLKNSTEQLKQLSGKQKDLADRTEKDNQEGKKKAGDLKDEQQQLSRAFEDLKKQLEALDKKNAALERPSGYENPEKEAQQILQKQKESERQMDRGQQKAAAEQQRQAAGQMQQMAAKLEEMQQKGEEMQAKVNAAELRQLLENLLNTSFEQEKVLLDLRSMSSSDPLYTAGVQKQRNIKDNMKTIGDSLYALSRRVPQIESSVNEEMQKINFNIDKSLENLGERNTLLANRNQQYAMTSINNLSLMLNEALEQLQKNMKNAKSGGKGGQMSMQQLEQMQRQLGEQMQKAREEMQRKGNKGMVPKGQMSQEFARMAQQQQMIREALQRISLQSKDAKGKAGMDQLVKEMKETEVDLVNKKLTQETMERQKSLLTKLLDAEKAEREQDQDARREAKAAKDYPPSYQKLLEAFRKKQQGETEWFRKLPPNMKLYYKNRIAEYFKSLNSGN